jgi:uncharacterized OsmC-like protein
MHNVRVDQLQATAEAARAKADAAAMHVDLRGEWAVDPTMPQFSGPVKFPAGDVTLVADFPPFLGGEGRAPTPLAYCFYGAMCCYGATFATQAALVGVELRSLRVGLTLDVDFRPSLGVADVPPLSGLHFEVEADTDGSDEELEQVKALADERCPALWAMRNTVEPVTTVSRIGRG